MPPDPTDAQKGYVLKQYPLGRPQRQSLEYAEVPYTHTFNLQADQSSFAFDIQMKWITFVENGANGSSDAVAAILGIAQVVDYLPPVLPGQAPLPLTKRIARFLPWACPYFPQMYCSSITNARPFAFKGHDVSPKTGGEWSHYDRLNCTVTFVSRPYNLITDEDLQRLFANDESNRFVEKLPKPTAEYISILGNSYHFVEGTGPLASATGRFPLALGLITVKVDLEWVWHDVPDQFIMNADKVPTGIIAGLGCVNSAAIWGYPAGTLLALPPDITPHEQPFPPLVVGLQPYEPPRSWDVRFRFKFWDPPLTPGATTRGHNTAIWTRDNRFALIRSVNPAVGNTVYPTYDFSKFFKYRTDSLPANP